MVQADFLERAEYFLAHNVEPTPELEAWIDAAKEGDEAALLELKDRFRGPLQFGTAGLRGLVGAGEFRMNRWTVIRTTSGLIDHLLMSLPDAAERGVVIGRDGRHRSEALAKDVQSVCLARGVRVHVLPGTSPTPLVAYGVLKLHAAAGVAVTASHNPPAYNGYKVFWGNGAQIIPPHDRQIAARIDAAGPANEIPWLKPREDSPHNILQDGLLQDYLQEIASLRFDEAAPVGALKVAYTALHGVGEVAFRAAMEARGLTQLWTVAEQAEPDPDFPTVSFPNPEEPGAMDLVLALGEAQGVDLVLANDPDADRLGVAIPAAGGGFRRLRGDEIGVLLADHLLRHDTEGGANRLAVTTVVSSRQLSRLCAHYGVRYAETLTGFKWIANEALRLQEQEGLRFVFGYEEALGYTPGVRVRDKDGIQAALVMVELAAGLKAAGSSVEERLMELHAITGAHRTGQRAIVRAERGGAEAIAAAMQALRDKPPVQLGGIEVSAVRDFLAEEDPDRRTNLLIFELGEGGRVAVRPSGTEPKLKFYLEARVAPAGALEAELAEADARLPRLEADILSAAGLDA